MRVAILSESSADEAALRLLVDAMLGISTVIPDGVAPLRSRGWPAVRNVLPIIAKQLHHSGLADGLVFVADSNHATVIEDDSRNRLRDLLQMVASLRKELKPSAGRAPLKIAVGVASPAIEAWLLCDGRPEISEASWEKGLVDKREPYSKLGLKQLLYGVNKPNLMLETERMIQAANEMAGKIALLETRFPNGFVSLAKELRTWRTLR